MPPYLVYPYRRMLLA